jgi:hypothetical protein
MLRLSFLRFKFVVLAACVLAQSILNGSVAFRPGRKPNY